MLIDMSTEIEQRAIYESHGLGIKHNNCASNDPCAICGQRTDPQVGPELMLADSRQLVCHDCGNRYDAELVRLLEGLVERRAGEVKPIQKNAA